MSQSEKPKEPPRHSFASNSGGIIEKNRFGQTRLNPTADLSDDAGVEVTVNTLGEIRTSIPSPFDHPNFRAVVEKVGRQLEEGTYKADPLQTREEYQSSLYAQITGEEDVALSEFDDLEREVTGTVRSPVVRLHPEPQLKIVEGTPQTEAAPVPQEGVAFCVEKSCNTALPPNAKFCPQCGTPQLAKFCTDCGHGFQSDERFCPQCGKRR